MAEADAPPMWACPSYGGYEHDWMDCPECVAAYWAWINRPEEVGMTADDVRRLIGDVPGLTPEDFAGLVESANADPHEGADTLPRYKLAMALLAQQAGLLTGVLERLLVGLGPTTPAGLTVTANLAEAGALWDAHLKAIPRDPAPAEVYP